MNVLSLAVALLSLTLCLPVQAQESPSAEDQIRRLIPAATSIDAEVFEQIARGAAAPNEDSFHDYPLTAELMLLDYDTLQEVHGEFSYLSDGQPEPTRLVQEMYHSIGAGRLRLVTSPVTMIQANRITNYEVEVDGNTASGSFEFRVPELYEGEAAFVAQKENSDWRIIEFRMEQLGIRVRSDSAGHWWRAADLGGHPLPTTFAGRGGAVWSIDFSPDGQRLVSSSSDGAIRIWDISGDEQPLIIRNAHRESILSVRFSPDGKRIASASHDGTAKLWNAITGEAQRTLAIENLAFEARFSPSGKRVLVASRDISIWDALSGKKTLAIEQHSFPSVAYSPDGRHIASGGAEAERDDATEKRSTIRIWNATTGEALVASETYHGNLVTDIAYSPDGKRIATSSRDKTVRIWTAIDAKELRSIEQKKHAIKCLAFSPDGKWILGGDDGGQLTIWNVDTGEQQESLPNHPDGIRCVAFSPTGDSIATGGDDGVIRIWKTGR